MVRVMNCWKERGGEAPGVRSVSIRGRPDDGGSAKANLSRGWDAVASVVWAIRPFAVPFALETAGPKVTQGFLPPGNKPCDDVVAPAQHRRGCGDGTAVSLGHRTWRRRSCGPSLPLAAGMLLVQSRARLPSPVLPSITPRSRPTRGRRAALPVPGSSRLRGAVGCAGCDGWGAPGAGGEIQKL